MKNISYFSSSPWSGFGLLGEAIATILLLATVSDSHSQTLAQALNTTNLTWTTSGTSGASGWTAQNGTTHDGVSAAGSGTLFSSSSTSTLQTVTNGPATLTFWWYCPSSLQRLAVLVNNVEIARVSGKAGWEQRTIYLGPGSQTVKWVYSTFGATDGQRGYLDEVAFTAGATAPIIDTQPLSQSQVSGMATMFKVTAVGTPPLAYQWQFFGTNLLGATNKTLIVSNTQAANLGDYAVLITNSVDSILSSNTPLGFGHVTGWGNNDEGETSIPFGLTNVLAISCGRGGAAGIALMADRTVRVWGWPPSEIRLVPALTTNVLSVACGNAHALVLTDEGRVMAWGNNNVSQTNVPTDLSNVVSIASGANHSLGLTADGLVVGWGWNAYGQTNTQTGLSNAVAIAAGEDFSLALKSDGTIEAWGDNSSGKTNVPAGLTNAVAIAAGSQHALALTSDGKVVAWGLNFFGQTSVPTGLSNVVAISCGGQHSLALKSDGTVVAWGQAFGASAVTNVPPNLTNVLAVEGGYRFSIALVGNAPPVAYVPMGNPAFSPNGFTISILTQSGRVYRLEYKSSLSDPDWTPLPLVAGSGTNLVLTDPSPASSHRFYRVRRW